MCPEPDERVRARRLAMDLLARRDHSRLELTRKMAARRVPEGLIEEVLERLSSENLLNERRFAETFVQGRLRKGKGPVRILHELKERGVDGHKAELALEEAQADWVALAAEAMRKRFGESKAGDLRERARRARFLGQRGFSGEQIRQALDGEAGD